MPEDYATPPPPPPPPTPVNRPYGQMPPYGSPYGGAPYSGAPYSTGPYFAGPYSTGPGYGVPPPRRRSAWFYIGIITGSLAAGGLLITLVVWGTMRSIGGDGKGLGLGSDTIAVIDITGVILSPEAVDSQLRKFGDDHSGKGVI